MKKIILTIAAMLCMSSYAYAIPDLQLYIEGANYDSGTETWVGTSSGQFTLWVMGDSVYNVKLAAAYASGETGTISFTPTLANTAYLPAGGTDTTTPSAPTFNKTVTDGTAPIMGDGSSLPTHGIYGAGTSWSEWLLGDLTGTSDSIGDYITVIPTSFKPGQLNAYLVDVTGFTSLHFDAYDHTILSDDHLKYVFAPFSHDAETNPPVPEPGTLMLLGVGMFGLAIFGKRRMSKNA